MVAPETKLRQFEKICATGQRGRVDGKLIDLFSASAVLAVYRAINPEQQAHYLALPPLAMCVLAFKLLKHGS